MRIRTRQLFLTAMCTLSVLCTCNRALATIDLAVFYNDQDIGRLTDGLRQFDDFGAIDLISSSAEPSGRGLSSYDAVLVTNRYKPQNSTEWGNTIADYAEAGGGVTLGFAFFSTWGPAVVYGRLEDRHHAPFAPGGIIEGDSSLGEILIPSHPLMEGVDDLTTHYRYNVTVNDTATVVANFEDGLPLAGYIDVGLGRVVGIQAHYALDPHFTNEGDFMQLYRNAIVYSVPEPTTLLLLGLGSAMVRRRRR